MQGRGCPHEIGNTYSRPRLTACLLITRSPHGPIDVSTSRASPRSIWSALVLRVTTTQSLQDTLLGPRLTTIFAIAHVTTLKVFVIARRARPRAGSAALLLVASRAPGVIEVLALLTNPRSIWSDTSRSLHRHHTAHSRHPSHGRHTFSHATLHTRHHATHRRVTSTQILPRQPATFTVADHATLEVFVAASWTRPWTRRTTILLVANCAKGPIHILAILARPSFTLLSWCHHHLHLCFWHATKIPSSFHAIRRGEQAGCYKHQQRDRKSVV